MKALNFPRFIPRLKKTNEKTLIFDIIRKKFVVLQPEEWVRQHCINFLITEKGYPLSLINVEKELTINSLKKRYDIVIYNTDGSIQLIVECKAPKIVINQSTFDQIARYNMALKANYLMVTNGTDHYYCQMNFETKKYVFLKNFPNFIENC